MTGALLAEYRKQRRAGLRPEHARSAAQTLRRWRELGGYTSVGASGSLDESITLTQDDPNTGGTEDMSDQYQIIRFHRTGSPRRVRGRLTLEEAQAHCSSERTHGGAYCVRCDRVLEPSKAPPSPLHCPDCGGPTVVQWFDGYDHDGPVFARQRARRGRQGPG